MPIFDPSQTQAHKPIHAKIGTFDNVGRPPGTQNLVKIRSAVSSPSG